MKYFDSQEREIGAGMVLVHEEGEEQEVFACGDDDLGFSASNPDFLRVHPEAPRPVLSAIPVRHAGMDN